ERRSKMTKLVRNVSSDRISFVIFDRRSDVSEVDAVDAARSAVENALTAGVISIPEGVSYTIAGTYEDFVESRARLAWLVPVVLVLIFLVLQWQFRSFASSLMIYSSVLVSVSGGLVWLWLYGQPAFAGFLGETLSTAFHVGPVQLSVAVWVGFIALAGLATDDGVVLMTYLERRFASEPPGSVDGIREAVVEASVRRLRPCLMTTGTTLLALLPLLTSNGRGADLMLPIALPLFGGMLFELASLIVVPTLFCWRRERALVGPDETVYKPSHKWLTWG
ncbi:MAG: efflux RND transporter permease subunit, partial [Myxococcota bacterium]